MVTDEGKFVVAVADSKAWASYQKIQQSKQETNEDINVDDPELKDPETNKLFRDPVRTKCCNRLYSKHIIEDSLLESDFKCPNCGQEDIYLDSLEPDKEMQEKVDKYLQERNKKRSDEQQDGAGNDANNKRQKLASPTPAATLPQIPQHQQLPQPPQPNMGLPASLPIPPMGLPFMPFPPMGMPTMGMPMNMQGMGNNGNGNGGVQNNQQNNQYQ
ncbi:unnamed protein product [Ambrosiozyma monospora]|uniref:Unnamed protein product n=1 Tax=Ambrosiozyma monospora TaxID=43982 RepID=A0ACB5TE26_AMBMO|nr:unnamed protein product [Ambrosiozyma monospora]